MAGRVRSFYAPSVRALALLSAAMGLIACGDGGTATYVPAPSTEDSVAFFAHLRSGRPVGLWKAETLGTAPIRVTLEEADQLAHVAVPTRELDDVDPLLTPASFAELTLAAQPPCAGCEGVCTEAGSTQLSLGIPASATVSELVDDAFGSASDLLRERLSRNTRLQLQRDADQCTWSGAGPPELFGAPDLVLSRTDEGLRIIDHARILVTTPTYMRLALRGRGQAEAEQRALSAEALAHEHLGSVRVLSVTSSTARLLLLSKAQEGVGLQASTVYEVEASEAGFRVLGVRAEIEGVLNDLHLTPDGGFVGAGDRGLVVVAPKDGPLTRFSLAEGLRLFTVNSFPERPGLYFVGGTFGFVAEGELAAGPSGMVGLSLSRDGSALIDSGVSGIQVRPSGEGMEVWAVTRGQGAFRRRGPGDWVPVDIESPPGRSECSSPLDPCGRARLIEIMEGLTFGPDGRLFYAPWQCRRIFTRYPDDPCTQLMDLDGVVGGSSELVTALQRHEDRLYFVQGFQIWSVPL